MAWAPEAVQKMIFSALNGSAAIQTALGGAGRVLDFVPDNMAAPFIRIGEMEQTDRGSQTTDGWTHTFTIHCWFKTQTRAPVLALQGLIDAALHNLDLTPTGFTNLTLRRDFATSLVEPDNVTYHGIQRFRILTGEN